jgi:transposase-like protein
MKDADVKRRKWQRFSAEHKAGAIAAVVAGGSPIGVAAEYSTTVVSLYNWLRKAGYYPKRYTQWVQL